MKKSLLVAAVLLSIGSGCLLPQEVGATYYYWDQAKEKWATTNPEVYTGNKAVLPKEVVTVSEGDRFHAGCSWGNDEVSNNSITVGNIEPEVYGVYGGFSSKGSATSNEVEITGGNYYTFVYGGCGLSKDSIAKGNKVTISGTNTGFGYIYGGYANGDSTTENVVTIDDGDIRQVEAGFSDMGSATGNIVNINGGSIEIVLGAESGASSVTGNVVNINGGSISEYVVGGLTYDVSAENNTVNWKAGDIKGNIYGSAVSEFDYEKFEYIYKPIENNGGTFNVYQNSDGRSKTLAEGKELGGFDYMNFITDNISNPVVTADKVILADNPKFGVAVSNDSNLKEGNIIKLLKAGDELSEIKFNVADNYSIANMPEDVNSIAASDIAGMEVIDNTLQVYYKAEPDLDRVIFGNTTGVGYVKISSNDLHNLKANDQKLNLDSTSRIYFAAVGGFSKDEDVSGNKVTIDGVAVGKEDGWYTTIDGVNFRNGNVYGGYSINGSATGNEIEITNGSNYAYVYGGYSGAANPKAVVQENKVTISGEGTNITEVYGGYSFEGSAISNEVEITGGNNYANVYGGCSLTEDSIVKGNKVTISGTSTNFGYVTGGYSMGASTTENVVTIDAGNVNDVRGGESYSGSATGNIVNINGGSIEIVKGAFSVGGSATGNVVSINGGCISGDVIGGHSEFDSAENNTVNWKAGDMQGNVYGSVIKYIPVENNGGTFNVYHNSSTTKTISAGKSIAGFDKMNFYLSGNIKAEDIIIDNSAGNTVKMDGVSVSLQNDPEKDLTSELMQGDKIYLIKKTEGSIDTKIVPLTANGMDYDFEVSTTDDSLIAKALSDQKQNPDPGTEPDNPGTEPENPDPGTDPDNPGTEPDNPGTEPDNPGTEPDNPDPGTEPDNPKPQPKPKPEPIKPSRANEETKALLEGHAAAALAVNQMVDNTINVALKDAELAASANDKDSAGKFNTFVSANYNKDRISTGSYVDVKGLSGTIGIARKLNNKCGNLTYGLFLEGGKNKFDTSNDFASGTVHGKGDANSFGGGFFAKQKNNSGMYVEGSLRVGRVNHDFEGFVAKQNAEYDAKSTYYGAHIGLGKLIASGKGEWDVYGKLIYTHINGATADVYDGSKLELDAMNSTRLRIGGRYNVNPAPKAVGYYAGIAYEYEFGGQADGKLQGFGLEAPTSKGSTGILELGAKFQPSENFGIDLGVEGHAGKRRGVGGNVNFKWSF